jgi:hypothetical protein
MGPQLDVILAPMQDLNHIVLNYRGDHDGDKNPPTNQLPHTSAPGEPCSYTCLQQVN